MYFGEYLSQGALKIEGKCEIVSAQAEIVSAQAEIVSAQAVVAEGLYNLRLKFEEFARFKLQDKPPWAKPVVNLRKHLFHIECPEISNENLQAVINIAKLFGSY